MDLQILSQVLQKHDVECVLLDVDILKINDKAVKIFENKISCNGTSRIYVSIFGLVKALNALNIISFDMEEIGIISNEAQYFSCNVSRQEQTEDEPIRYTKSII